MEACPVDGNLAKKAIAPGFKLEKLYLIGTGAIQLLSSLAFGCLAALLLARDLGTQGSRGIPGHVFALRPWVALLALAVTAFVASYGLIRLRSWVWSAEVVYLGVCFALFSTWMLLDYLRSSTFLSDDWIDFALYSAAFTLPYVPIVLFRSWLSACWTRGSELRITEPREFRVITPSPE
jgi:hypothetical protein